MFVWKCPIVIYICDTLVSPETQEHRLCKYLSGEDLKHKDVSHDITKSPRHGMTLCFKLISVAVSMSGGAAAETFPSHGETLRA